MMSRNFSFVSKRKIWYIISSIIIVAGIISFFVQGLNLGIDYTGGTVLQLDFAKDVSVAEVREELAKEDMSSLTIQKMENGDISIKLPYMEVAEKDAFMQNIRDTFGETTLAASNSIGPSMGAEILQKGLAALAVASILMIVYISVRFEWRFALSGIIGLLHDILVTFSLFSIFQWEIDSTFVAAILTIFGYSINDTIVIFDRIRERLGRVKRDMLADTIDKSINQTLTRSIYTTLSTLILLVALLVFGGDTTKMFVLAMTIGIASGAYSSIFIASPLWYDMSMASAKKRF